MSQPTIVQVAVPSPLRRYFDYFLPAGVDGGALAGSRVQVPFGNKQLTGLVHQIKTDADVETARIKEVQALLDPEPLIQPVLLHLLQWASQYYHHAPGEVCFLALPPGLRKAGTLPVAPPHWRLTEVGADQDAASLARAPHQQRVLRYLAKHRDGVAPAQLLEVSNRWQSVMQRFQDLGWVETYAPELTRAVPEVRVGSVPTLHPDQVFAGAQITTALHRFQVFLLQGVTGSGKTEVYFNVIEQVLAAGRQVLMLTPEINLTPQLMQRFQARFTLPVQLLHSAVADGEKLRQWDAFRTGQGRILIGTRSAIFTPAQDLGLIIVDEEHDGSFKQQEGFRYHARDIAVMRASLEKIPVILGSATPSLESLHNVAQQRYTRVALPQRAGAARPPKVQIIDMRREAAATLVSAPLLHAMKAHLAAGNQTLLFLNRRGYAPVLFCHDCGWSAKCERCEVHYTWHRGERRLRCHHCGGERPQPAACPQCAGPELHPVGAGTQKIEEALAELFPGANVVRIDRDSTRRKGSMETLLDSVDSGEARILVGTQMLAKGHDFPNLTLVGVLDADQGLYSTDYRAGERLAQLLVQVMGRAGRGQKPGEVFIQTHQPEHPLFATLMREGYEGYSALALAERRQLQLPPYSYQALVRCRAKHDTLVLDFMTQALACARPLAGNSVQVLGPVPAAMARRGGDYRYLLLLQSTSRKHLHGFLDAWLPEVERLKSGRKVHWSLDVDPVDMY